MKNSIIKLTCISLFASMSLHATTLKESVEKVLSTNPEVIAEKKNQEAFRKYVDEKKGNYYPKIDVDGRLEKNKTTDKRDTGAESSTNAKGQNVGIALNQMLYDGSLTPSQVREAKYNDVANNFRAKQNIEDVVLETVSAYTGLVQYNEMLNLTSDMIGTNEDNLQIAKEKEAISGEILETYQVDSKLNFVKEKYLEEKDLKNSKVSTFKRYIGVEPDGNECRPTIDEGKIPSTLQQAVELAVTKNNQILEQVERVKAQREKIAQADSKFLPNLNLELKAIKDTDLALADSGKQDQSYGRVNLAWNLFNGGSDYAVSKQEELFLAEQKQKLDAVTRKVVESVKVSYERYNKNKERIKVLRDYVKANESIVQVYKSEFESGTRTFVDILDAQTTLYEAKKSLVNREYDLYSSYYDLLNTLGMLTDTVLATQDVCSKSVPVAQAMEEVTPMKKDDNSELGALLGDEPVKPAVAPVVATPSVPKAEVSKPVSKASLPFLDASKNGYTVNIATKEGLASAQNFVKSSGLDSNKTYVYEFGPKMNSVKVIYGIFDSVKEASDAISKLPASVKASKPYVDRISKHQKLYYKYH